MNVEIGTEAAQFPEKEYVNGICVAVQGAVNMESRPLPAIGDCGHACRLVMSITAPVNVISWLLSAEQLFPGQTVRSSKAGGTDWPRRATLPKLS
jgi:hypothetical protein